MKLPTCFLIIVACCGCVHADSPEVTFEYFNLSTNEIWVTGIAGLPPNATPGRMMPSSGENELAVKASVFNEAVRLKDQIIISWKDNGKQGWPGGLNPPGSIPPGIAHEAKFTLADLGIPTKLSRAKVRFTYLGQDKWRIKIYGPTTTFGDTDQLKDFSPPYQKP